MIATARNEMPWRFWPLNSFSQSRALSPTTRTAVPGVRPSGTPVSGMPILDVDKARSIIVIKRSMGRGYAGIDNELYTNEKTGMLFADAKEGLASLTAAVKAL